MRLIISFTIFSFVADISRTENSKESQKNITEESALKFLRSNPAPVFTYINPHLKALWVNNPLANSEPHPETLFVSPRVLLRKPHSVTRLIKMKTYNGQNVNPSFSKSLFEPFERRPKPITLIAFRKRRPFPQNGIAFPLMSNSLEVAEMQSPYNDIGHFWQDKPMD